MFHWWVPIKLCPHIIDAVGQPSIDELKRSIHIVEAVTLNRPSVDIDRRPLDYVWTQLKDKTSLLENVDYYRHVLLEKDWKHHWSSFGQRIPICFEMLLFNWVLRFANEGHIGPAIRPLQSSIPGRIPILRASFVLADVGTDFFSFSRFFRVCFVSHLSLTERSEFHLKSICIVGMTRGYCPPVVRVLN